MPRWPVSPKTLSTCFKDLYGWGFWNYRCCFCAASFALRACHSLSCRRVVASRAAVLASLLVCGCGSTLLHVGSGCRAILHRPWTVDHDVGSCRSPCGSGPLGGRTLLPLVAWRVKVRFCLLVEDAFHRSLVCYPPMSVLFRRWVDGWLCVLVRVFGGGRRYL